MWRCVGFVRTYVWEELITSVLMVERISELGTTLAATINVFPSSLLLSTMKMEAIRSSEMSVPTSPTRRHITEDGIVNNHHRENLESHFNTLDMYSMNF
jgi:hypothetical protein